MPTVDAAVGVPAPALAGSVRRYLGYDYRGFPRGVHRGLPSRHLTIVISLGAPTRLLAGPDPRQPAAAYPALVGGLHSRPVLIEDPGDQCGVQLELTPTGARDLLGVPAGALASTVVELGDLIGGAAGELAARMAAEAGWPARFAVLDEVLTRLLRSTAPRRRAPEPLAYAWHLLLARGGTARVADLAAEVGWSRRHLGACFTREYGLTPKEASRVVRFERSRRLLDGRARPTLAAVAAATGYFDQAHLAREWGELAGCPPSTWLATEQLPSVQAAADGAAAGWGP